MAFVAMVGTKIPLANRETKKSFEGRPRLIQTWSETATPFAVAFFSDWTLDFILIWQMRKPAGMDREWGPVGKLAITSPDGTMLDVGYWTRTHCLLIGMHPWAGRLNRSGDTSICAKTWKIKKKRTSNLCLQTWTWWLVYMISLWNCLV